MVTDKSKNPVRHSLLRCATCLPTPHKRPTEGLPPTFYFLLSQNYSLAASAPHQNQRQSLRTKEFLTTDNADGHDKSQQKFKKRLF